jgi:hypothetical protein
MIMVSRGKFQAFYKKWIHFDLNQVRIILFDVEAILTIVADTPEARNRSRAPYKIRVYRLPVCPLKMDFMRTIPICTDTRANGLNGTTQPYAFLR